MYLVHERMRPPTCNRDGLVTPPRTHVSRSQSIEVPLLHMRCRCAYKYAVDPNSSTHLRPLSYPRPCL